MDGVFRWVSFAGPISRPENGRPSGSQSATQNELEDCRRHNGRSGPCKHYLDMFADAEDVAMRMDWGVRREGLKSNRGGRPEVSRTALGSSGTCCSWPRKRCTSAHSFGVSVMLARAPTRGRYTGVISSGVALARNMMREHVLHMRKFPRGACRAKRHGTALPSSIVSTSGCTSIWKAPEFRPPIRH